MDFYLFRLMLKGEDCRGRLDASRRHIARRCKWAAPCTPGGNSRRNVLHLLTEAVITAGVCLSLCVSLCVCCVGAGLILCLSNTADENLVTRHNFPVHSLVVIPHDATF